MARNLKEFLKKKKGYCSEGRCSCLLLSARRDYEVNGCNCEDGFYPMPTSITLSKTEVELNPGDTETITATVLPEEAAPYYPVRWSSSDDTVATVSGGVITYVGDGDAIITAKSGNVSATVAVTCKEPIPEYLCFTANEQNSKIWIDYNYPGDPYTFEYSLDGTVRNDMLVNTMEQIATTITLSNVGDKVYVRNKSAEVVSLNYYQFNIEGSVAASGDCNYLLCKNSTTEVPENGFRELFSGNTGLTSAPQLPATTLGNYCYRGMFQGCTSIKLSETQTGEYQTPYRIPATGTGTAATDSLKDMFASTGGTFTGTPTINTTYYTSNTVI